jgi:hypothetical protein
MFEGNIKNQIVHFFVHFYFKKIREPLLGKGSQWSRRESKSKKPIFKTLIYLIIKYLQTI